MHKCKCKYKKKNNWTVVWRKTGEAQKSSVKFPQSVMIWDDITSAGVGPLCFIKSKVNAAFYQEILDHFMLPSDDKLYGDADFLFQQDFSTCSQCQKHFQLICWPWYYCAWLASQRNHIWNLCDIFKRKMRNSRSNNRDELKAQWCLSRATGWSLPCYTSQMLEFVLTEPDQVLSA